MKEETTTENKGGRPSLYSVGIVDLVKAYLETCEERYETKKRPVVIKLNEATGLIKELISEESYIEKISSLPTIEGLALYLGISRDTIYEWEEIHPEFSDIIGVLRAKQANQLINKGLNGTYNPTISKVLLTKHGYREGIDNTSNGKTLKSTTTFIVEDFSLEEDKEENNNEVQGS